MTWCLTPDDIAYAARRIREFIASRGPGACHAPLSEPVHNPVDHSAALRRMGMTETFETINAWQRETFPNATLEGIMRHLNEEWKEFWSADTIDDMVKEAVDLIIVLSGFIDHCTRQGAQVHVDNKMRINRARSWNIQPDGSGRHA